jgi:hypothetical protein
MSHRALRSSFLIFHCVLGAVVFLESVITVLHAHGRGQAQPHALALVLFAGAEAIAALLFLLPATMRVDAIILLLIFGVAFVIHGVQGDPPLTLLVYAAGVALVMIHGSVFGRGAMRPDTAA